MNKLLFAGLTLSIVGLLGVTVAAAQESGEGWRDADTSTQNFSPKDDTVSQRDRDFYTHADIQKKFGVHFQSHRSVCDMASGDAAHCDARVAVDALGKPMATPKVIAGYGPSQLRSAYSVTGKASGHPVIAIVDANDDPTIVADLATYSSAFGLPQLPACTGAIASSAVACFKKVNQRGATQVPRANAGWALEISLDVEAAHAMCENCSILLVEADSASYTNLMAGVDRAVALGAAVVSNSYGSSEFSSETLYDSHFNHPGVAFTFAAGDGGYGAEYPAASKYVTAVGGTSLFLNPDGTYNQELAWGGTGSGCSTYEIKPAWQTDVQCTHRTVADVSAVADPNTGAAVYDSTSYYGQRGWFQVGGTSLATPVIAAIYALSGNTAGAANSIPYVHNTVTNMRDVTSGSNGSCGGSYLCTAVAGFDGPTGLGSPLGLGAF